MSNAPSIDGTSAMSLEQPRSPAFPPQRNSSETSQWIELDQVGGATRSSEFMPSREVRIAPVYSTPFVPVVNKLKAPVSKLLPRVDYTLTKQKNRQSIRVAPSSIEKVLHQARQRHHPQ
jgi:hypothetical protein